MIRPRLVYQAFRKSCDTVTFNDPSQGQDNERNVIHSHQSCDLPDPVLLQISYDFLAVLLHELKMPVVMYPNVLEPQVFRRDTCLPQKLDSAMVVHRMVAGLARVDEYRPYVLQIDELASGFGLEDTRRAIGLRR